MRAVAAALLAAAVVLVYLPGISGPLLFDDYQAILKPPALAPRALDWGALRDALWSAGVDYPRRGIVRVSFALDYLAAGARHDPAELKRTNVLIHAANAVLVLALVTALRRGCQESEGGAGTAGRRSPSGRWLPFAVAAVWALHPLQVSAVLYAVQRMTLLAGTFVLAGLLLFACGRMRVARSPATGLAMMAAGLAAGAVLGGLCKENALLIVPYALLIEWFWFSRKTLPARARRGLVAFRLLLFAAPIATAAVWLATHTDWILAGYANRAFTPIERLLTEGRALFLYLRMILLPAPDLFALLHDDFAVSRGLLVPPIGALAALAWISLIAAALWASKWARPPWAFALLWFVVGHSIESTVLGLEPLFEHRNYLPSIGPLLAVLYLLGRLLDGHDRLRRVAVVAPAALIAAVGFATFVRAESWSSRRTLIESAVRHHPASARAQGSYAAFLEYGRGDLRAAFPHWQRAARLDRGDLLALIELQRIAALALGDDAVAEAAPGPDPLAAEWPRDVGQWRAFDAAVARAIDRRLATAPVSDSSANALRSLAGCLETSACVRLAARARDWVERAANAARISTAARAVLLDVLASLQMAAPEPDAAIASWRRAIAIAPRNPEFRLRLIEALLGLGRRDAAERELADARAVLPDGVRRRDLDALGRRIAASRSGG